MQSNKYTQNILYGGYEGSERDICGDAKSFGELLFKKLEISGDFVLFIDGITDREFTANEILHRTIHLAKCMQERFNIKSGDAVGICCENRIEFALTAFATVALGATLAPFNTTYTEGELNHAVNLSKPRIVFVSRMNYDKAVNIWKQNHFISAIVAYDGVPKQHEGDVVAYTELIENCRTVSKNSFKCAPQNMKENVIFILCSSGTTGLPKGVQLTQYGVIVADSQHYNRARKLETDVTPVQIISGVLPWFHAFGCLTLFLNAMREARTVFLPKFHEKHFLHSIQKHRINTCYVVPPLMVLIAKSPLIDQYDLSSLKVIWVGAAPLSKEVEDAVRARIGVSVIRQGYGMTEATLAFTGQTDDAHTPGSVGIIRSGFWGKVIDTETGVVLGPNQRGELCFKGTTVMKGYVGDVLSTSATIDKEGWLHTGDIGYYDDNGEWYIVDRIKELIKFKAFQVPPAEIEAVLLTHPGVKDVGVIGVPDDEAGELPLAFVVQQHNVNLTKEDIIEYVAARVSPPKRLHGGVIFVNEIPKNPSGKILRRVLREMVKNKKSKL